jgi:hypothetical protein
MDHYQILNAYLSRLHHGHLENILKHDKNCLHQMLNGNNSAQLDAQAGLYAAVCEAVKCLGKHDIEIIERIVERSINKIPA